MKFKRMVPALAPLSLGLLLAVAVWLHPLGEAASQYLLLLLILPWLLWGIRRGGKRQILMATTLGMIASLMALMRQSEQSLQDALLALVTLSSCGALSLQARIWRQRLQRSEKERLSQQDLLENLIRHAPALLYIKDMNSRYLLASESYNRLLGQPDGLAGKTLEALFPQEEAALIRHNDQLALSLGESITVEETIHLNGEARTFLAIKAPFQDDTGHWAGLACSSVDITERKAAEQALKETESKFQALANLPLLGIFIVQDGRLVYLNEQMLSMTGYSSAELLVSLDELPFLPAEEGRRLQRVIESRLRGEEPGYTQFRCHDKQGNTLDALAQSVRFTHRGRPAVIGILLDMTEKNRALEQLRLTAKVFENASEGIVITDAEGRITAVNDAFSRVTGYTEQQAIGKRSRIFNRDRAVGGLGDDALQHLKQHGYWQGDLQDIHRQGHAYPVWLSISAVHDEHGQLSHHVAVFSDITARKEAEVRLHYLANHDPLTGLPNRTLLHETLQHAMQAARLHEESLALFFIDLDRFKIVNDSLGHDAGDQLLQAATHRLAAVVGQQALRARLGGDEFVVLLERCHEIPVAAQWADRFLQAMAQPFSILGREFYLGCSIGISLFPHDGSDGHTLLKNADLAMYRAKEAGKNTYQFFAPEMNTRAFEFLMIEHSLRQAMANEQLELYYQPQVRLQDQHMVGVEALLRWQHPELGQVPPSRFIPLAEETGLIVSLGIWLLQRACMQLQRWHQEGRRGLRLSLNLSPRQFNHGSLLPAVQGAIKDSGIDPGCLELEITEGMIMQQPDEARRIMGDLRRLGVRLAIDDFGTGYSSLANLKLFPIQTLKIDRAFITGLADSSSDRAIAATIIQLGKLLGMTVIAEGVENQQQLAFLNEHGCDIAQGYWFGAASHATKLPPSAPLVHPGAPSA